MLRLKLATDPRWANLAEKSLDEILTDHAYCEQKAATSGISIIIACPQNKKLVDNMTALVAEEWGHFRKVLKEIHSRGFILGKPRKDEYVLKIKKLINKIGDRNYNTCEQLLLNALIEARSCERFRVLSVGLEDEYLKNFYHEFMVSEAEHYRMFIDLANDFMPEAHVKKRWEEILSGEADIMKTLDIRGDRVH